MNLNFDWIFRPIFMHPHSDAISFNGFRIPSMQLHWSVFSVLILWVSYYKIHIFCICSSYMNNSLISFTVAQQHLFKDTKDTLTQKIQSIEIQAALFGLRHHALYSTISVAPIISSSANETMRRYSLTYYK